jgi:hypothetical protein
VARHRYDIEVFAAAPQASVFEVLADARRWHEWAPMISRSSYDREGDPAPHGVGAVRRFASAGVGSLEEVVVYVPPEALSYEIRSRWMPIRDYRADVRLRSESGGTHVSWQGAFTTSVPGASAGMRWMVGRMAAALAAEAERRSGGA